MHLSAVTFKINKLGRTGTSGMPHKVSAELLKHKSAVPEGWRACIFKQGTCKTLKPYSLLYYQLHVLPEVFCIRAVCGILHVNLGKALDTAQGVTYLMGKNCCHLSKHSQTFLLNKLFFKAVVASP